MDIDIGIYLQVTTRCLWFSFQLTENGITIVIWVGSHAPNEFVSKVFGVGSQAQVDPDMVREFVWVGGWVHVCDCVGGCIGVCMCG